MSFTNKHTALFFSKADLSQSLVSVAWNESYGKITMTACKKSTISLSFIFVHNKKNSIEMRKSPTLERPRYPGLLCGSCWNGKPWGCWGAEGGVRCTLGTSQWWRRGTVYLLCWEKSIFIFKRWNYQARYWLRNKVFLKDLPCPINVRPKTKSLVI